jgi:uncharacterized protein involved in response to NO
MELKISLGLSQLISLMVFITIARWYVAPWVKSLSRATALIALIWPHVFRYVALQAYSARHAGFPISDTGLHAIIYGDLGGAIIAMSTIVALRHRSRAAISLVWLLVITTVADTVINISDGVRENLFGAATGVTWMVVGFYVPMLMVSLGLIVWQLYSRRSEPLEVAAANGSAVPKRLSLAS